MVDMNSSPTSPRAYILMQTVNTLDGYIALIKLLFKDKFYSLTRAYVLQLFTEIVIQLHPHIREDVKRQYNNFIYNYYHPLEFITLFI
jgi:hypothetical protein